MTACCDAADSIHPAGTLPTGNNNPRRLLCNSLWRSWLRQYWRYLNKTTSVAENRQSVTYIAQSLQMESPSRWLFRDIRGRRHRHQPVAKPESAGSTCRSYPECHREGPQRDAAISDRQQPNTPQSPSPPQMSLQEASSRRGNLNPPVDEHAPIVILATISPHA